MHAIAPSGMPGTRIVEGRVRNGKGISEPMSTSGFHSVSVRSRRLSAKKIIGGMPTPPPMRSVRGRIGCGTKHVPIGPRQLMCSPTRRVDRSSKPLPTIL